MDLNTIQQALGLAGASLASVGSAADLVSKIKSLVQGPQSTTPPEVQSMFADLVSQIATAKVHNADLQITLADLRREAIKDDETRAKLARYELRKTPGGDLVYALRADARNGEPEHFICPRCYEDGVRAILQQYGCSEEISECRVCKSTFTVAV